MGNFKLYKTGFNNLNNYKYFFLNYLKKKPLFNYLNLEKLLLNQIALNLYYL